MSSSETPRRPNSSVLTLEVNGEPVSVLVKSTARLIDVLREQLGLLGTKEGCGNGECGACTVFVDGQALNACLYPALEAEGASVVTIEGLGGQGGQLSPVQQAFVEKGGVQCGFCSPGMIMSATSLLRDNGSPSDREIRDALVGNLCRCTGYVQIVDSVRAAAEKMQQGEEEAGR